jgi:two-component system NarL family sensor kinase
MVTRQPATEPDGPDANPTGRRTTEAGSRTDGNGVRSGLNVIAAGLNAAVGLDEALRAALSGVAELLDVQSGWVLLLDESGQSPFLAAAQNLLPGLSGEPQRLSGPCTCMDAAAAGDSCNATNVDLVACVRLADLVETAGGRRFHASVPLRAEGRALGVLNVATADWLPLSPEALRLLQAVGDMLGIAVDRARLAGRRTESAAAEERNRLAREIHDSLAQGLSAIAFQLETAETLLDTGAAVDRVRAAVAQALAQARESLDDARRSVLDLRAAPLEGRALASALGDLVSEWKLHHDAEIVFAVSGSMRTEVGLYRIAQEALSNAGRYARARYVNLTLAQRPGSVLLTVEDDGVGFDTRRAADGRYGLLGMNERAHALGGRFRIQSSPGQGTRVEVEVPA